MHAAGVEWMGPLFVMAGAVSMAGTWLARRSALARSMLDRPNSRSLHTVPTPRGGGIAIAVGWCLAIGVWALAAGGDGASLAAALLPPAAAVAAIGWWDDHTSLPARWRLAVHLAAAAWAVWALEPAWLTEVPGARMAVSVVAVVALAWSINLYNFMDGVDGLAGAEAVFVALAASALVGPTSVVFVPLLTLAAASAGFLAFNWPPARIFMGDAGSCFLGFALGGLLLGASIEGTLPLPAAVVLMGAFVVDATVTLGVRALRAERLYQAHRHHAYQHWARRTRAHRPVTVAVMAINGFWLLPMAAWASYRPDIAVGIAALALAPLVIVVLLSGAGRPED